MDTYVYEIDGKDYINLTNKCTNACTFCVRNHQDGVDGYKLWLKKEPAAQEVVDILAKNKRDVVFCGFGEPTTRIDALCEIADFVKSYGGNVRINTNGHGNAYNKKDIVPMLKGRVDTLSISLNGSDGEKYQAVCKSVYGEKGFDYTLDFARESAKAGIEVILSVVSIIGDEETEKCRKIAKNAGAKFRVRKFF